MPATDANLSDLTLGDFDRKAEDETECADNNHFGVFATDAGEKP